MRTRDGCIRFYGLVGVLALMSAACAPQEPSTQATDTAEVVTTTPAEPTEGARVEEAEITYVTTQTTATLDPAIHVDESQSILVINAYDSLLIPNSETGEPESNVATDWEVSDDGQTYTFKLRDDIRFHDGATLTADDVVFSMDRMLSIGQGFSFLWEGVLEPGDTTAVDDHTVEFQLARPHSPFLASLVQFFIVNKNLVLENLQPGDLGEFEDYGQAFLAENEAGSGAYGVRQFQPGTLVVLEAFEDYWKGWEPGQVTQVNFQVIGEHATEKLMIEQGEADIVEQWLDAQLFEDLKKVEGVTVQEDPSAQLFFLTLNTNNEPLDDVSFRRALSYTFPYDVVAEQIFGGAVQAQGPVPIRMPGHAEGVVVYEQNLERAREELEKSDVDPVSVQLTYVYVDTIESERKVGLAFQDALRELGIELEIRGETFARITEMVTTPETTPDMVAIFHTAKYPSPDSHSYAMFHPEAHGTYMSASWFQNEVLSRLLEEARAAATQEEATAKYQEAQGIVAEEAAAIFATNSVHRIAHRDRIQGYKYVPILGWDLYFYQLRVSE